MRPDRCDLTDGRRNLGGAAGLATGCDHLLRVATYRPPTPRRLDRPTVRRPDPVRKYVRAGTRVHGRMAPMTTENMPTHRRVVLTGISSRAWEHPADRGALTALRELRGFDDVLKAIAGIWNER